MQTGKDGIVLIVEDESEVRRYLEMAVRCQGFSVELAENGEEALAYIERWEAGEPAPVFIMLDLRLPKVDGLEVLRRLKKHPIYSTIPVIILTTSAEDNDVQEAYRLGCNSYIVKPVEFDKFMEVASQVEVYWGAINRAWT